MSLTFDEVYSQLETMGTEQNRKVYQRHGASGNHLFGVSFANLKLLKKKLKVNHEIAQRLWASKNYDARQLAMMIADPARTTSEELDQWIADCDNYGITGAVAGFVFSTPFAHEKMMAWHSSDDEWKGMAGWDILGNIALHDPNLPDSFFEPFLQIVASEIHTRKNRVRYSMNNAVICIGGRNQALREQATEVAQRIGKVMVDHGETGCKTPDAVPYINKMWARRN